jgi:ubiquitin-conjugating enzyme E2 W
MTSTAVTVAAAGKKWGSTLFLRYACLLHHFFLTFKTVMFINNVPLHPHVYSNGRCRLGCRINASLIRSFFCCNSGHICLSILADGWSPALTVQSICLSLISMLSSCPRKERPPDNDRYVQRSVGKSPKETKWFFHDGK